VIAMAVALAFVEATPISNSHLRSLHSRHKRSVHLASNGLGSKANLFSDKCKENFKREQADPNDPKIKIPFRQAHERFTQYKVQGTPHEQPQWIASNTKNEVILGKIMQSTRDWVKEHVVWQLAHIVHDFLKEERKQLPKPFVHASIGSPKSVDSALRKIMDPKDYNFDPTRLTDGGRGYIVYQTKDELEAGVCRFYTWLKAAGAWGPASQYKCEIIQDKDKITNPNPHSGYMDFNLLMRCQFGHGWDQRPYIVELQFQICSYLAAKEGPAAFINKMLQLDPHLDTKNGHHYYEIARAKETDSQAKILAQANEKRLYSMIAGNEARCLPTDVPKFQRTDWDFVDADNAPPRPA